MHSAFFDFSYIWHFPLLYFSHSPFHIIRYDLWDPLLTHHIVSFVRSWGRIESGPHDHWSYLIINRFRNEGDAFLDCIITCNETWTHSWTGAEASERRLKRRGITSVSQSYPFSRCAQTDAHHFLRPCSATLLHSERWLLPKCSAHWSSPNDQEKAPRADQRKCHSAAGQRRPPSPEEKSPLGDGILGLEGARSSIVLTGIFRCATFSCSPKSRTVFAILRSEDADAINLTFRNNLQQLSNSSTLAEVYRTKW